MKRLPTLILVAILSAAAVAQDSDVFILREQTPAPAFSLQDLSGKTFHSRQLAGKVAVLSFGATWCTSCTATQEPRDSPGQIPEGPRRVLRRDGRPREKDVKPYLEKHGYAIRTLVNPKMAVARENGIRWLPVTLVLNRKGVIVGRAIGAREWDGKEALEFIQPLIGK